MEWITKTFETALGNEFEVEFCDFIDTDYIDGRCVRREHFTEVNIIRMNGKEISYDDLTERNQEFVIDCI